MSDISILKRMFEQNFKLNEPIDSTLKPYEACYFNGTVWTNATVLIPPTGFLAEKLVNDVGNIALGSEVPVETLTNTALSTPVIANAIYHYDPVTRLLNTTGTGWRVGTGYAGAGSDSQYGSIIVNINQSSGAGTVTNVSSANADISVVNPSTAPVLTFNRGTTVTESGFSAISEFFTYVGGIARRITATDLRDFFADTASAATMCATQAEVDAGVVANKYVTAETLFNSSNLWQEKTLTFTPAEVLNSFSVPLNLLPAPGAGKAILVQSVMLSMVYNTTPYTVNTLMKVAYGFGGIITNVFVAFLGGVTDTVTFNNNLISATSVNTGIQLYTDVGNPIGGDSTIKCKIWYKIITL